jgi:hypothetical protein
MDPRNAEQKVSDSCFDDENNMHDEEKFESEYDILFNRLRSAAKYQLVAELNQIKRSLTRQQFQRLIEDKNSDYTDCAIIHYAVKYNKPASIEAIVGHLSIAERFKIFQIKFESGCNSLHFAANGGYGSECSYEAAVSIKELLCTSNCHYYWSKLLSEQQIDLETPIHYAARHKSSRLLKLFSDNLHINEWIDILSIKNESGKTAIEVYFWNYIKAIRMNSNFPEHDKFMTALRGPLDDRSWVTFLIKNKILEKLSKDTTPQEFQICIRELKRGLPISSINRLMIAFEARKYKNLNINALGVGFFQANRENPLAAQNFSDVLKFVKKFL